MKLLLRIIFAALSIIFLLYLLLPEPAFPNPPSDAIQSFEPADSETPLRRAYFTDFTRREVMDHYQSEFAKPKFFGIYFLSYILNYPPEEAHGFIRDQTRSTFLEEIVHPFRESFFVNGFEPKDPKDVIYIEGKVWKQKITVRYIPSNRYLRVVLALATIIVIWVLVREWKETLVKWTSR